MSTNTLTAASEGQAFQPATARTAHNGLLFSIGFRATGQLCPASPRLPSQSQL